MSRKSQTLTTIGDKFNAPQYFSSGASGKVQLGLDRWRGIVRKSGWAGYLKRSIWAYRFVQKASNYV